MLEVDPEGILSKELCYRILLTSFLGLDSQNDSRCLSLVNNYLNPAVKQLDTRIYASDSYYKNIKIETAKLDCWDLGHDHYEPYEAFIYNDLLLTPQGREIPRLGFFDTSFSFPVVRQNGREWMAVKPNEIETMKPALNRISKRVVTFGLGLGYFVYMASLNPDVEHITVVEKDPRVIALFKNQILPQFPTPEKLSIVLADAFAFVQNPEYSRSFDFAFADLWHDTSDGFPLYQRFKSLEHLWPQTQFLYWIEESLRSAQRWQQQMG